MGLSRKEIMLYTPQNAMGAKVIDMDASKEIGLVLAINDETGFVKVASQPMRLDAARIDVASELVRFRSIYPIRGAERRPVLFHCYGRLSS